MLGDAIRIVDEFVHTLRNAKNANGSVDRNCEQAANLIELLVKERDEARKEICHLQRYLQPLSGKTDYEYAQELRWDCFIRSHLEELDINNAKFYAKEETR